MALPIGLRRKLAILRSVRDPNHGRFVHWCDCRTKFGRSGLRRLRQGLWRCNALFALPVRTLLWTGLSKGRVEEIPHNAQATAAEVMESLRDCRAGNRGVNSLSLLSLDRSSVYKAAQEQGLWEIVKDLFEMDANTFVERYSNFQADALFSITDKLNSILFRGDRPLETAGQTWGNATYSRIDAGRVIDYVSSHDSAFEHWLHASLVLTLIPFDNNMAHRWVMYRPEDFATHVMRVWNMVWADHNASKFILWRTLDADTVDKKATKQRANFFANKFKAAFAKVYVVSRNDDDEYSGIEGLIHQLAAMIDEWFQRLNIPVRMDAKFLKLPAEATHLHRQIAVPAAKATIRKGRKLTQEEFQRLPMGL